MKHTPGKWLVMGNVRNGHTDFVLPMADDKDFQANARLIAAAPELLEALILLQKEFHQLIGVSSSPSLHNLNEMALQAIAKAEGR